MSQQPRDRKQEQQKEHRDVDKMSKQELIELVGGQRAFNEKFYEIFGDLKKE